MSGSNALPGPTALVTGASSGIGLELSKLLATKGFGLIVVGRDESSLNELTAHLRDRHSIATSVIVADLGKPNAASEVAREAMALSPSIDILINSAGRGVYGPFLETPLEWELEMLQLNMVSLTELTKHILPAMVARRRGRVMNVASTAAFVPGPLMAAYYATKAYVLSFSEALANELQGTGVTVTALCPPATRSGFQAAAQLEESRLVKGKTLLEPDAVARAGYAGMIAGRRVVIPGVGNWLSIQMVPLIPRKMRAAYVRALQARA